MYARFLKRFFDLILSFCALVVLSPIMLIVALLVRKKLGTPVIFSQQRPGRNEKLFRLFKFRSMTDERDADGKLLPDSVRLTSFGRKLRSTSLDELPELFNIFKGDMAIVGPRPLLTEYLPWYSEEEKHRHDVRPGLTGLAQVNGRNNLGWDDRLQKDIEYVKNISFSLDVKIILMTIKSVFSHSDIEVDTSRTEGNFAAIRKARLEAEK